MRALGIALSFMGSSCDSVGTLLQKKAQAESTQAAVDEEREEGELDYVKTCTWRTGFGLFTFGSIMAFVAIGIVGPSVIVVVSAFALVVNLVLSPRILGEARRWSDWVAVFFIVVGICLAITATETNNDREVVTVGEVAERVSSRKAQAIWVTLVVSLVGLTAACRLPKGQSTPVGTLHHMIFVARPAVSGTTTIMLAAPTSALIQDPVNGPAWMWALPVAMICSTVMDIHFVNKLVYLGFLVGVSKTNAPCSAGRSSSTMLSCTRPCALYSGKYLAFCVGLSCTRKQTDSANSSGQWPVPESDPRSLGL